MHRTNDMYNVPLPLSAQIRACVFVVCSSIGAALMSRKGMRNAGIHLVVAFVVR